MTEAGWLQKAARWLEEDFGAGGAAACGTGFLTLAILLQADESQGYLPRTSWLQPLALLASFVLCVLVAAFQIREIITRNKERKDTAKLREDKRVLEAKVSTLSERAELDAVSLGQNIRNVLNGYLLSVGQGRLRFGSQQANSERISLFVHTGNDPMLENIARVTFNPDFDNVGRLQHPTKAGVIAMAWRDGEHFENGFPDPDANNTGYIQRHVDLGLTKTAACNLRMRSRLYYALRIDVQQKARAVVVVEALAPDRFTAEELREALRAEADHLSRTLQHLQPYIPTADEASKVGL